MYLSFFIKPETEVLAEIKNVLELAGFEDIKSEGVPENYRIVIFNGRESNNFCFAAHRLSKEVPIEFKKHPFLVRVGNEWTVEGLIYILSRYLKFQIPDYFFRHFPKEEDFVKKSFNKKFLVRLFAMKNALLRWYSSTDEQVKEFDKIIELAVINDETIAEIKKQVLYFLIEYKLDFPWGHGPTKEKNKEIVLDWLQLAKRNFPKKSKINQDRKIEKIEDTLKVKLT